MKLSTYYRSTAKPDPHLATHHILTGDTNPRAHWRFGCPSLRHTRRQVLLPTTSTQPILDAFGPFWSRSGP